MKFIITIGRQYGSGGRFIAKKLAEELGIKFYDNELLAKAAIESGLSNHVIETYDEKKDGLFSGVVPSAFSVDLSLGQKVFLAQFEAIKKVAEAESAVIVGRCADYVLEDMENVVNVFVTAPMKDRVERAIKYYNVEPKKAENVIVKMDKKRASYYNFYSDKKWGKADTYDLCLNSSVGIDESVKIIKEFVKAKLNIEL
ncbi:MAG: cytidylate kinase-like family protein [Acholeplasmatales bacterium]|nr:cytidylate kinase-like family protein [Acholeplasmatales bacterium]